MNQTLLNPRDLPALLFSFSTGKIPREMHSLLGGISSLHLLALLAAINVREVADTTGFGLG